MNTKNIAYILLLLVSAVSFGQSDMDVLLKQYNTRSVPYISVQELKMEMSDYLILDTRKKEEFDVSHIPGAVWVSEKVNDSMYAFAKAKKDQPIVVYCSVGIRSEDFGERLKKKGIYKRSKIYTEAYLLGKMKATKFKTRKNNQPTLFTYFPKYGESI